MRDRLRKYVYVLILGGFVLVNSGCVALLVGAAAGATGIAYFKGTLEANFDRSVKQIHQASIAALKDLKLIVKDEDLSQHSSKIMGEYDDGTKVQIDIEAFTEKSCKIKIRIGVFGNEEKSQIILNAIKKRL